MNTAIVAIDGDATLCTPGDATRRKLQRRRHIVVAFFRWVWYNHCIGEPLLCSARTVSGFFPRGPCVLLTSETAEAVRQSPAADDGLPAADEGLSVVYNGPTPPWTLDGHLRMTLPFAASALRPQTMPVSCAFRCAHVHRRASFVPDPVRPSLGARRVCRCARRTVRGNKSIRD